MVSSERTDDRLRGDLFAGGGEMGELMRRTDWSSTPLGPVESWPDSLRTAVSICLHSRFPILIWWGPQLVMLYNDAYRSILGTTKHPASLGQAGRECWPEIWDIIGPMLDGVLREGRATWSDDQMLPLDRNGYVEEAYFTFSYSPIHDETGGIAGVFTAVTETTGQVLSQRRLRVLRELATRGAEAQSAEEACAIAGAVLAETAMDEVPFSLLYLLNGNTAELAGSSHLPPGTTGPGSVDLGAMDESVWPLRRVAAGEVPEMLVTLTGFLPSLPGDVPSGSALVLPVVGSGGEAPVGLLVAGVSARRALDDDYRGFFELLSVQIAALVAGARAYEVERRRAEALEELDRAKTTFFSNVSHEFRTPLTLTLGPLEDVLASAGRDLPEESRALLELSHRNGLRLLKLVNTLLDFSRIEAGRFSASYEPVDLATYTAELASLFRSATERAGLRLSVDCPPLPEPVYVDRQMWEKIVLNLLSNAFKFTFEGEIAVSVYPAGDHAELVVRDTGTGIEPEHLPHLWERFHRVEGAKARTHEGTGIGLALVQELVHLQGGEIWVDSVAGKGSSFTVSIPMGTAHLPASHVHPAGDGTGPTAAATPFVDDALRWLPSPDEAAGDPTGDEGARQGTGAGKARILVADDNADMRGYIHRLLRDRWEVETAGDGETALAAARSSRPDLIVADVMMPRLDGFALLKALRGDRRTATIPVILLSARAGEEARVEGLEAGADAYLVKPFSAAELVAQVEARLGLDRTRHEVERAVRESEERFRATFTHAAIGMNTTDLTGRLRQVNEAFCTMTGYTAEELLTFDFLSLTHPDDRDLNAENFRLLIEGTIPGFVMEKRYVRKGGDSFWGQTSASIVRDSDGNPQYMIALVEDISERKRARAEAEAERRHLHALLMQAPAIIAVFRGPKHIFELVNPGYVEMLGPRDYIGRPAREVLPEMEGAEIFARLDQVYTSGEAFVAREMPVTFDRGGRGRVETGYFDYVLQPIHGAWGRVTGIMTHAVEVTDRVASRREMERMAAEREAILAQMADGLCITDVTGRVVYVNDASRRITGVDQPNTAPEDFTRVYGITGLDGEPMSPEDLPLTHALHGETVVDARWRMQRPDGTFVVMEGSAAPALTEDGALLGVVCTFRDVTRQWDLAEDKEKFLSAAAHDLKTPLTSIKGLSQLLVRQAGRGAGPERLVEGLRQIDTSTSRMSRLIDELLDNSRTERGEPIELRRRSTDLVALARQVVAEQGRVATRHRVRVETVLPRLVGQWDAERLERVLSNLVGNAVKYSPDGGGITVAVTSDGSEAVLTVTDAGIGISPDDLPHVFERFYRGRNIDRDIPGTGIGLAGAKQIVERHGGTITVGSREGEGSTFTVRLPTD